MPQDGCGFRGVCGALGATSAITATLSLTILLLALAPGVSAADKPRKTLTFQPGAKTPDATPAPGAPASDAPAVSTAPATPAPRPGSSTPAAAPAPAPASAAITSDAKDEPGRVAEAFFTLLQKNLIEEAYTNLTKGSKIAERPEELKALKARTTEAIGLFGAIQGFELIDQKPAGASLLRRTYVSLGRDYPLRWRFYFYRSGNQWRLVDLRVDDRLGGLFEEPEDPRAAEPKP